MIFLVLNDDHLSQVLSNILQVKERGATSIVITNLPDISKHIEPIKIDHLVQLAPGKDEALAALQTVVPLQLICYETSVARGLNPDSQLCAAIDLASALSQQ